MILVDIVVKVTTTNSDAYVTALQAYTLKGKWKISSSYTTRKWKISSSYTTTQDHTPVHEQWKSSKSGGLCCSKHHTTQI
jgi:hypothetical protein